MPAPPGQYQPIPGSDSHVHTRLCGHAEGEMEEYVLAAIEAGLDELIFLEHMEEGIDDRKRTWLVAEEFAYYFREGERLQKEYGRRLQIGLGVECGYNPECRDTLRARLLAHPWAQIGISCHFLRPEPGHDHLNLFSRHPDTLRRARQYGPTRLLSQYFHTLTEGVESLPASKVCHLDAALRFLPEIRLEEEHYGQIATLLRLMRKKGVALEVNTSGLHIRGEIFPNRRILAMARELSLELLFGSDAHHPRDVAGHFSAMAALLPPSR